ncbi:hypothetical protein [Desmospora activa]|uniref:hypothetical protein n=1 Tax=Desmospora activa TaxID=500615 RepID=UPI0011B26BC5|nr:hypothetical protein [Desmospora activa]
MNIRRLGRVWLIIGIVLAVMVTTLLWNVPAFVDRREGQNKHPLRQVWVISVYGLSLQDLQQNETPHLHHLLEKGVIGAMNVKTGGKEIDSNRYATLGAGTRAVAPPEETFFQPEESVPSLASSLPVTAASLYKQWLGSSPTRGSIIYPAIMEYIRENEAIHYTVAPGALGEALRKAGMGTMALGNLDEGERPVRWAPLLTMDRRGITAEGSIGRETLDAKASRPFGVKSRYSYIGDRLFSWSQPGVAVVELGDLYRLQQLSCKMAPRQQETVKRQVLKEMDAFIGKVINRLDESRLLLLLSPSATDEHSPSGTGLFPIILYRPGEQPGLLISDTTRRTGIVSSMDVAPTILSRLGVEIPTQMLGQPVKRTEGTVATFRETIEKVESIYRMRPPVLYSYILVQMVALVVGLSMILKRRESAGSWMQIILLGILLAPFLFLMISGVTARSFWLLSGSVLVSGWLMALLLTRSRTLPLLFWVGIIGFVPVVVDGLLGGPLIQQSFLGYDPIKGARYYGIGNEYMGVVLGSSILTAAAWLEWRKKYSLGTRIAIGALFLGLILFFAAPFWGTNAGGALAAMVGFGVAYLRFFWWGPIRWWHVAGAFVLGLGVLLAMNFSHTHSSHIGRAWATLAAGDLEGITNIIQRKLEMNWRLLRVSSWGKVFLLSLFAMGVLAFRPVRGLHWMTERYPQLFNGFAAIVAGALAALVLNDSGIVSAATAIVYVVMPVMIIGYREWISHGGTTGIELEKTSKPR